MSARRRHVPERRCVGCGKVLPRQQLMRVSVDKAGTIVLDGLGGRGAYVCRSPRCIQLALQRGKMARALRHDHVEGIGDLLNAAILVRCSHEEARL